MTLKRSLGLFDAVAIGVGAMIGAGIFVVTGLSTGLAGPAVLISIIIAGAVSSFTALSFAELSAAAPSEGGAYEFVYEFVSPKAGFFTGWLWLFSNIVAGSAISLGLASYLTVLFPVLPLRPVAAMACLFFTAINIIGVKHSSTLNNFLVVFKICVLAFFILLGVFFLRPVNFYPFSPTGLTGVFQGSAVIFFAFTGFARITTIGEEVKNPGKIIPRAILISIVVTSVIYLLTAFAAVGLLDYRSLAASASPIADAAQSTGVAWAGTVVSLGALAATGSVLLTLIMGLSRVFYKMSKNKDLPPSLSLIHRDLGTPYLSILIMGAIMTILTFFFDLGQMVGLSIFGSLFYYALTNLAAFFVRRKIKGAEGFRTPLYPLIPILGLLTCFVLLFSLDLGSLLLGGLVILLGAVYLLCKMLYGRGRREAASNIV